MDWQTQNLRFAIFHPAGATEMVDAFNAWTKVFKRPPDNYSQHPQPGTPASQAVGVIGEHEFTISATQGREDIAIAAHAPDDTGATGIPPMLPDLGSAILLLQTYGERLLADAHPIRLSLVANFYQPTESLEHTYNLFRESIPGLHLPDNATELVFQFNNKTVADGTDVQINRICRWSTVQFQAMNMALAPDGSFSAPTVRFAPALSLFADVNMVPRSTPLETEQVSRVVAALVDEVLAVKSEGYARLAD